MPAKYCCITISGSNLTSNYCSTSQEATYSITALDFEAWVSVYLLSTDTEINQLTSPVFVTPRIHLLPLQEPAPSMRDSITVLKSIMETQIPTLRQLYTQPHRVPLPRREMEFRLPHYTRLE